MTQPLNRAQQSAHVSNLLYLTTFIVHLAWIAYVLGAESMGFLEELQLLLANTYATVGFEWKGNGAYLVTAALVSSLLVNTIKRVLEGAFLGWPRFAKHDKNSLAHAFSLLVGYGLVTCFAIGYFGEKYSSRPLGFINIGLISIFTYIFGLLVNFVDEVISAIYCIYRGAK